LQHQQQVATAVERAKQVTMTELNAIIGVSLILNCKPFTAKGTNSSSPVSEGLTFGGVGYTSLWSRRSIERRYAGRSALQVSAEAGRCTLSTGNHYRHA
jgi:hypothetical protein